MQVSRSVLAVALVGVLAAACGGGGPTQAPGAATQIPGGGGATTNPGGGGATTNPGGGGATTNPGGGATTNPGGGIGNTTNGKMHIEISGPVTKTADYGFIPEASVFSADQGASLSFTNEGTNEVVSVLISADGSVVVSWGTAEFSAPAAECTTSNWNVGGSSASGAFDCTAGIVIFANGTTGQNAKVKGSFDARK